MSRELTQQLGILCEPDDVIEFRPLRGRDEGSPKRWARAADAGRLIPELSKLNRQGWNIYFGVNPRKGLNLSGDANVLLARTLFADFDHIDAGDGCGPSETVEGLIDAAGLPAPSLLVNSGHGIHAYWRLAEPVTDMSRWRILQKRVITTLGSDPAIHNPERIMRAAGFLNTKREPYAEAFIVT